MPRKNKPKRAGKLQLTKRKDSPYWYITGTIEGRRFIRSTRTTEKVYAEEQRIEFECQFQERRIYGEKATATFSQAVKLYLGAGKSPNHISPLLEYFRSALLKDITYAKVMEAAHNLYPGRAPGTINRQAIGPMSAIVNFAAKADLTHSRQFPKLKEPKGRLRWLTPEDAELLIEACRGQGHLPHAVMLLLGSGLRAGEALSLHPSNLHIDSRQAFIADSKTGDSRMVEYPARTAAALSTLDTLEDSGTPMIRAAHGQPYFRSKGRGSKINIPFNTACKKAGLVGVTPHTLRHTWATWYYAATNDFVRLMALGGWSKPETAMRYTKLAPRDLRDRLLAHNWDFQQQNSNSFSGGVKNVR